MDETRKVKIRRLTGYRDGEIATLPLNRALTYCRNGQADPEGWVDEGPVNRMLVTGASTRKGTRKKVTRTSQSDSGE